MKKQIIEFFEFVNCIRSGVIRRLEIRGGLPFSMDVEISAGGGEASEVRYKLGDIWAFLEGQPSGGGEIAGRRKAPADREGGRCRRST